MTVVDSTLDEHYKDEAALAMDVAAALNEELRDLQAAGCDVLEIDGASNNGVEQVRAVQGRRVGVVALQLCPRLLAVPGEGGLDDPQYPASPSTYGNADKEAVGEDGSEVFRKVGSGSHGTGVYAGQAGAGSIPPRERGRRRSKMALAAPVRREGQGTGAGGEQPRFRGTAQHEWQRLYHR